jgi:uncharacterized protein with HEPN domain
VPGNRAIHSEQDIEDYSADGMLMAAVERQFMIIGEALRAAEHIDPAVASKITRFRKIIDFRNVLVHDYATVYPEGIWEIIRVHLPRLRTEVEALLAP